MAGTFSAGRAPAPAHPARLSPPKPHSPCPSAWSWGREHRHGHLSPQPFSMRKGKALASRDGEPHKPRVPVQGLLMPCGSCHGGTQLRGSRAAAVSLSPRAQGSKGSSEPFCPSPESSPALTSLALPLQFLPHTHTASSCYLCQQRETDTVH